MRWWRSRTGLPRRFPASARAIATLSIFDWCVVSLAGADQPVSSIMRNLVLDEGGEALRERDRRGIHGSAARRRSGQWHDLART